MCPPKAMDGEGDEIALMTFSPPIICEDLVPQALPSVMEATASLHPVHAQRLWHGAEGDGGLDQRGEQTPGGPHY